MLKKPKYNLLVETLENGNKLLFNTMTSIFGIMDSKAESLYENIEVVDTRGINDPEDLNNIDALIKGGYIIPKEMNEIDNLKVSTNMKGIILHL